MRPFSDKKLQAFLLTNQNYIAFQILSPVSVSNRRPFNRISENSTQEHSTHKNSTQKSKHILSI